MSPEDASANSNTGRDGTSFGAELVAQIVEDFAVMEPTTGDTFKIMRLYARYAHAIDAGDGDTWSRCYTHKGSYWSSTFGECLGRTELSRFAIAHFRRWTDLGIQTRHWNNQILLEKTADGVSGSIYVMLFGVRSDEDPKIFLQTVYSDQLVREDGQWRLKSRRSNADSQT